MHHVINNNVICVNRMNIWYFMFLFFNKVVGARNVDRKSTLASGHHFSIDTFPTCINSGLK